MADHHYHTDAGRRLDTDALVFPYQRILTVDQAHKLEGLEQKMKDHLDDKILLWVRKTRDEDDIYDKTRFPYSIAVTPETSTDEIMDMVQHHEELYGFRKTAEEEALAHAAEDAEDEAKGDDEDDPWKEGRLAAKLRERRRLKKQREAGVVIVFCGEVVQKGRKLKDYPIYTERRRWSKPYGGVLWLAPTHLAPGFVRSSKWGKRDLA